MWLESVTRSGQDGTAITLRLVRPTAAVLKQ
jgi:hypothetical protein